MSNYGLIIYLEKERLRMRTKEGNLTEIEGFEGYLAYMDNLSKSSTAQDKCTYEESQRALAPKNHGSTLSDLYSDFEDEEV